MRKRTTTTLSPADTSAAASETKLAETNPAKQPGPIEQATQLHSALREALNATGALVRTLRKKKKQERLFKTTLASLRELQNVA